jgi:hypothetical protein
MNPEGVPWNDVLPRRWFRTSRKEHILVVAMLNRDLIYGINQITCWLPSAKDY